MMKLKLVLIAAGLLLVLFSYSSAQVPQLINYQGKLTKASGAPLDTTISMVFSIYDAPVGGTALWTETQGAVVVDKGIFNVLLGSVTPIPYSVFDGSIRYLSVQVGSDPEITPRKPMVSVPYAYRAATGAGDNDWTINGDNIYHLNGYVGIGTASPNEQLEITGNLRLPPSTASVGVIKSGPDRFIHNFGTNNFFAGVNAGNLTLSGSQNTAVGRDALQALTTGWQNTAMGPYALYSNTTGYQNTAMGTFAFFNTTTGNSNTAVGLSALASNTTGWHNTAMGQWALYSNTTGYQNTAMGTSALYENTTGYSNTALGIYALDNNNTGYGNTAVGYGADVSATGLTNATAIGYSAVVGASNALVLGGTGANAVNVGIGTTNPQGALDVTSTTGALIVPRMTTAQRDSLTAVNGMIIYNTTTNQFNFREDGAWVTK